MAAAGSGLRLSRSSHASSARKAPSCCFWKASASERLLTTSGSAKNSGCRLRSVPSGDTATEPLPLLTAANCAPDPADPDGDAAAAGCCWPERDEDEEPERFVPVGGVEGCGGGCLDESERPAWRAASSVASMTICSYSSAEAPCRSERPRDCDCTAAEVMLHTWSVGWMDEWGGGEGLAEAEVESLRVWWDCRRFASLWFKAFQGLTPVRDGLEATGESP